MLLQGSAAAVHRQRGHRRAPTRSAAIGKGGAEAWSVDVAPAFLELARGVEAELLRHPAALAQLPSDPRFAAVEGGAADSRLAVQNRFYRTPRFRKCHLELAAGANALSVLHCVMYPWAACDLPLFSVDMVGFGSRVTLAICDVCPSREDLTLPASYQRIADLAPLTAGLQLRGIPHWGTRIFSRHCVCVSPRGEADVAEFSRYTLALLRLHLEAAEGAQLRRQPAEVAATVAAHARFCHFQLQNDKTRRILAAAMGGDFADEYMTKVLFDAHLPGVPTHPHQG